MTRLVYDESLWMWKCENCNGKMYLPGIAPSVKMLVQNEWNYCPHCGEKIDYSKTQNLIHKAVKWEELINKIELFLIEEGQADKRFAWGEFIKYTPSEVGDILRKHADELSGLLV